MPMSCKEIKDQSKENTKEDGVYTINIGGSKKEVYCDMTTEQGGWTVRVYTSNIGGS